jgi:glucokinase
VIREHREVSRKIIADETGLSTPSITRLVNELIEANILCLGSSAQEEGAGPGRPASVVKLNPSHGCVIGVDLGEHEIHAAIGDMSGKIAMRHSEPAFSDEGGEATFESLIRAIREVHRQYHAGFSQDLPPLRSVTIGVAGMVDPNSAAVVDAPNVKGWKNYPLRDQLESKFPGLAIRVENDVNVAAIGESVCGVARGCQNFVFAGFRRGIGSGIFIGGKLYRGNAGFAGEIGKMSFDPEFKHSQAGGLGFLETVSGESVLLERAAKSGCNLSTEQGRSPTLKSLCQAAVAGDEVAAKIVDDAFRNYGVAIANIASLLDPELVVVGGELAPIQDLAVTRIGQTVRQLIPNPPRIEGSSLGPDAPLVGAFQQAHRDACEMLLESMSEKVSSQ